MIIDNLPMQYQHITCPETRALILAEIDKLDEIKNRIYALKEAGKKALTLTRKIEIRREVTDEMSRYTAETKAAYKRIWAIVDAYDAAHE